MSDVETALTGAEVAPVVPETTEATQAPQSTTEQVEEQEQEQRARDEKGRFVPQERLNEVTRHRREAERERDYWRAQAEQRQQAAPSQPNTQSIDAPPSLADCDYDMDKWSAAVVAHAERRAVSTAEQRFQQQSQRQHQQTIEQQFEQRSQEYAKTHPDFDQAVTDLGRAVQFHPAIVEAIGCSELGPELVHHLAQHLDEADRLARLPPHIAAVQLGRIEAQLTAPKAKPVTNAPNPPPTLGGGKATVTKNPDDMPLAEWTAWRNSSLKKTQGR
jgi:hypothetical protein